MCKLLKYLTQVLINLKRDFKIRAIVVLEGE
jgi:hypothetical protein